MLFIAGVEGGCSTVEYAPGLKADTRCTSWRRTCTSPVCTGWLSTTGRTPSAAPTSTYGSLMPFHTPTGTSQRSESDTHTHTHTHTHTQTCTDTHIYILLFFSTFIIVSVCVCVLTSVCVYEVCLSVNILCVLTSPLFIHVRASMCVLVWINQCVCVCVDLCVYISSVCCVCVYCMLTSLCLLFIRVSIMCVCVRAYAVLCGKLPVCVIQLVLQ